MPEALSHVVDVIDVETYLLCASEDQARQLASALAAEMNLPHADIVFLDFQGIGARVRLRAYIHRPGDHYRWLEKEGAA